MPKFRKKPVVVEAIQLTSKNIKEVYEFVNSTRVLLISKHSLEWWDRYLYVVNKYGMEIMTLEDGHDGRVIHVASIGDWVIKGVQGEFYPCKPEIFEQTYELVNE